MISVGARVYLGSTMLDRVRYAYQHGHFLALQNDMIPGGRGTVTERFVSREDGEDFAVVTWDKPTAISFGVYRDSSLREARP